VPGVRGLRSKINRLMENLNLALVL
jgi:hypothetical protein